ncbi:MULTISPECIES: YhgE/Pip domain-containing protein [Lysinibacillus]|jgi:putative membrane protein|uniref:YhgE/Pip domain-containing protein n=1 Tax=Lysinibacillus fusiformis TaxID=28031 RepID=A0A2I0V131_9BACI|nr:MULTISPECIES: YhgE/Pip domain-containing protein [Lysinibacillus]KUF34179.1 phage infection protein [Lysinibacillus sp. F5]MEE3805945.1 YhgE/Pip domain-containing protein [Lysinibacillus fusiformis]PKU51969.1 YhgE/Pip domain-containing protein [Lysinibacillus fusiformis]SCY76343.1 putative membrane protein [Lysinibacillus sp. SG9]SDB33470.1 putative membrane protein [Lysinibacillus sp. TC-37]
MKNSFQHVFQIYTKDIRNIVTNWVVAVIIGGLIFLPSLYAWLNIYASMDPYAHTANMKIAIVNEDKGTTVRDDAINVGKEVIENLRTNNSFTWELETEKQALAQLKNGEYFAAIVIPHDFSEKLTSILTDQPTKAHIDYYVNEKKNPIAPKITSKGASVLTQQVSNEFVSTVNGTLFSIFNTIGVEMERDIPDFRKFENYVFTIEQHLPDINSFLTQASTQGQDANQLLNQALTQIPQVEQLTTDGLTTIQKGLHLVNEADVLFNELSPVIKQDVATVQTIAQHFSDIINKLNNIDLDPSSFAQTKEALQQQLTTAKDNITNSIQTLEALQKLIQADALTRQQLEKSLTTIINSLQENNAEENQSLIEQLTTIREALQHQPSFIDSTTNALSALQQLHALHDDVLNKLAQVKPIDKEVIKQDIVAIQNMAQNATTNLQKFLSYYNDSLEPQIRSTLASAKQTLTNASAMLTDVKQFIPQATAKLSQAKNTLGTANNAIQKIQTEFPTLSSKIKELATKLRTLEEEADIAEIVQLLKNDVNAERDFFEEPIKLQEHRLFPIANYGTAMTPFYTVLSIWVGCLLLISLLSVNLHGNSSYSIRDIYFGRLLTFGTFSFIQTLIITIGDTFLVDGSIQAPVYFILFGLFISLVFITVVYTLVSVFGNVGKALAIVMLVLQIAGSGGTYPVELLPRFFQIINPFLPFTYAIELMREAVGGIIWSTVWVDLLFLAGFWFIFILFGFFLKKLLSEKMEHFMNKTRGLDIFH